MLVASDRRRCVARGGRCGGASGRWRGSSRIVSMRRVGTRGGYGRSDGARTRYCRDLCRRAQAVRSPDRKVPGGAAEPSDRSRARRRRGCRCRREALSIDDPAKQEFLIAIAKTRVGDAATWPAITQGHGAIGFTKEYSLQLSTRRLWENRRCPLAYECLRRNLPNGCGRCGKRRRRRASSSHRVLQ